MLQYGRVALETVMKSVLDIQVDVATVPPPENYQGNFFKGNYIHNYSINYILSPEHCMR